MQVQKLLLSMAFLLLFQVSSQESVAIPAQNITTSSLSHKVAFLAYTAKFGKSYQSTTEFSSRFQLWLASENYIKQFKNDQVAVQHNKFSDWTPEERKGVLNNKLGEELFKIPDHVQLQTTTCPVGQFKSGAICVTCPVGCKSCVSSTFCTGCLTTNFYYNTTSKLCTCNIGPINTLKTDCVPCQAGKYFTQSSCANCLNNCTKCSDTTSCSLCALGQQFIGGKCVCNGPQNSTGWCSPCGASQFFGSNVCKDCPVSCTACTVGTGSCTICAPTFTLTQGKCTCLEGQTIVDGKCATATLCREGTYNLNNTCKDCPMFCAACLSGTQCTSCVNSGIKIVNSTDIVPCRNCDPTFTNTPIGQCRCPPNTVLYGSTCQPLSACAAANYNLGDGTCMPCEVNCANCASFTGWCFKTVHDSILINLATGKTYCPTNQILKNSQCVDLIKCPVGQYNDGDNNCLDCTRNCDVCTNVTGICQSCSSTYTLQTDKTCSCIAGQFLDSDTQKCVNLIDCGNGRFNPGLNDCTACVANCAQCRNVTGVCTQCNPTYTLGVNSCACNPDPDIQWFNPTTKLCENIINCPAGKYNNGNNICVACTSNCATCSFRTGVCTSCNATFTADTQNNACKCLTGQYMTATNNGVCRACNALCPTCSDITGGCLTCVNNLVVNTAKMCACPSGKYLNTVSNMCTICASNCTTCVDGTGACNGCVSTYTLSNGACACKSDQAYSNGQCLTMAPCESGFYNQGNNVCTAGPAKCTKVAVITGLCTTCNATFTYDSASNTCQCNSNQYVNAAGTCQTCPQNCTTCSAITGACTGCSSTFTLKDSSCSCNTTSTQEALVNGQCVSLISCPPTQYPTAINTCVSCPLAYCGICANFNGVCSDCKSTFSATLNSAGNAIQSCGCVSGQYRTTAGLCQTCPQNCTTCTDGTGACTGCVTGFTMNVPSSGKCGCNMQTQALVNGACVGLQSCGTYKFADNINNCQSCPSLCTTCSQIYGVCSACQNNFVVKAGNTCGCVNNTFASDGSNCQRCNVWVSNCDTCNSAGTCATCLKGYSVSGNSCVCNTGGGKYLDANGDCQSCEANCTNCHSHNAGYGFSAGHCKQNSCQSSYTQTDRMLTIYYHPYGSWGWFAQGTNNNFRPFLDTRNGAWAHQGGDSEGVRPYLDGDQNNVVQPPNCCNGHHDWRWYWRGDFMACVTVGNYPYGCHNNVCGWGCWWQHFHISQKSVTCACVLGSQTKNTAGSCAAIIGCPAQQYNDGTNTCKNCPSRCTNCAYSSATCTLCYQGATYNGGSNTCTCPVGTYGVSSTKNCQPCPVNCLECAQETGVCTTCMNNLVMIPATGLCGCSQSEYLATLQTQQFVKIQYSSVPTWSEANTQASNQNLRLPTSQEFKHHAVVEDPPGITDLWMPASRADGLTTDFVQLANTVHPRYVYHYERHGNSLPGWGNDKTIYSFRTTWFYAISKTGVNSNCVPMTTPPAGFYNPGNNTSIQCPTTNCYNCTSYTGACVTCMPTFQLSGSNCVCASGKYKTSSNVCQTCPQNCTSCSDYTGACTTCVSSYSLNAITTGFCGCSSSQPSVVNGVCTTFLTCPTGQYNPGNNACYNCPANCVNCAAWTGACTSCTSTFTLTTATNTCACRTNQYLSSGTCVDCPANCTTCTGQSTCQTCTASFALQSTGKCSCNPSTQALVNGACVALYSCPDGQYNPGNNVCTACATDCAKCSPYTGTCTQCNPTFISGSVANTCVCPSSQFKNSTSQCQQCSSNCNACSNADSCNTCVTTFSITNGVCGCTAGQYLSSTNNRCVSCPANCTSCQNGVGICTSCAQSFDIQQDGFCRCDPVTQALVNGQCVQLQSCPIGQYNPGNNICTTCVSRCYSCAPFTGQCTQCMPTFSYTSSTNTCTCAQTEYKTNQDVCTACPTNCTRCADSTGLCTSCQSTFTLNTPSSGKCGCVAAMVNGQCAQLTPCITPGKYNPGNNTCVNCQTSNCNTCNDFYGVCSVCSSTFTLNYDKTCTCNTNQFLDTINSCQNCPANCTTCYSPSQACKTCADTFILDGESSRCKCPLDTPVFKVNRCEALSVCPAGQFNPGNNTCLRCPANAATCQALTGTVTACLETFIIDETSNTCKCKSTEFLTQSGICQSCPLNCTSCVDRTGICTICDSTFSLSTSGACQCLSSEILVDGKCQAIRTCPSGQYNPGTNECVDCSTTCAACSYRTGACTSCKTSFVLNSSAGCSCPQGQFEKRTNLTTTSCVSCPTNCSFCEGPEGKCTKCLPSYSFVSDKCECLPSQILVGGQCVVKPTCSSNQFVNAQNQCQACAKNCTACESLTKCSECAPTLTLDQNAGVCACKFGQAFIPGQSVNTCSDTFTTCPTNQYNDGTNVCKMMSQNCTAVNNIGQCTACKATFFTNTPSKGQCGCNSKSAFDGSACVKPKACSRGQYNRGYDNTCVPCPQNCSACAFVTGVCTACKPSFSLNSGKCGCKQNLAFSNGYCSTLYDCASGNYNLGNNICKPCIANCASCTTHSGTCTKCANGFALANGFCVPLNRLLEASTCASNCLKCDLNQGKCLQCAPNSVRSKHDPSVCEECEFAVGPFGNATICLTKPSSSERVVPEYSASDKAVDWRNWSVVGPVKDQGKCGGDYAFSTAAAAKTAYAIKTGILYDLSEQYILDCDVGSFGCSGGYQQTSSKLLATEGAVLEQDYPYVGTQTGCRGNQVEKIFQLKYPGSAPVSPNRESFKSALRKGPINISFRVTDDSFFFYGAGILPGSLCPVGNLNHAMLAVGYGLENSIEYALIQNQWGAGWGEQGLIRVELTDDPEGPCGLYLKSSMPLV